MPLSSSATRLMVAAILAGVAFRIGLLGADSLWLDEAVSVSIATSDSVSGLWANADARHPPLYYILLKPVLGVAGVNESAARLPSAVASILGLALLFQLGRRLGLPPETRVLAVLLLATSSLDIWYAREARMYAMATTAGLLAATGLATAGWRGFALGAIGLALAVHLDFTMIPTVALLAGLWWVRWREVERHPISVVRAVSALLVAGLAVYPLWGQLREIAAFADGVTFFTNVRRLLPGFHLTPSLIVVGLAAETIVVAVAGRVAWRVLQKNRAAVAIPAAALFIAANAVLALPRGYSAKQILVTMWPYFALFTAWLVAGFRSRTLSNVVVLTSLAIAGGSLTVHRADWRGVVAHLNRSAPANAVVVLDPVWNRIPYDHYAPVHRAVTELTPDVAGDVWLVAERYGQAPPTSPTEAWLNDRARLVEVVEFSRLELRRYRLR